MFRYWLFIISVLIGFSSKAQKKDSLFVVEGDKGWVLHHRVRAGETVFSIARKYHVPPAIFANENNITYKQSLPDNLLLTVPLGAYNLIKVKPEENSEARPLYFRVDEDESLYRIARNTNVPQKTIQQWNRMDNNDIVEGQKLLVGWVLYDATVTIPATASVAPTTITASNKPATVPKSDNIRTTNEKIQAIQPVKPVQKDSIVVIGNDTVFKSLAADRDTLSEAEKLFQEQTNNGLIVNEEAGTAVFYTSSSKVSARFYYAFHDNIPKGRIVEVKNPGTGKIIYVKILGPLPQTPLYHNCIIGITNKAKRALGVMGDKVWCELRFAP